METKKSTHLVGSIICGLLTAFGTVTTVISLIDGSNDIFVLGDYFIIVLLLLILFYVFIGYKKPHGNLLKYIILAQAALYLVYIPTMVQNGNTVNVLSFVIEIGLLCYISGRLAKVKENLILIIIATLCIVVRLVSNITAGIATIGSVAPFVVWLDICVAYFLRYKEHREAGLIDAPKK